jgi:hypothetical protein
MYDSPFVICVKLKVKSDNLKVSGMMTVEK